MHAFSGKSFEQLAEHGILAGGGIDGGGGEAFAVHFTPLTLNERRAVGKDSAKRNGEGLVPAMESEQ